MKVLVVEDSSSVRRINVKVAAELGLAAIEAVNGVDALAKLHKHAREVALIILDWNMPLLDGYQTLLRLRAVREYDHIPVLMATSDGVAEDVQKAVVAGVNGYVIKPYTEEELSARIAQLVPSLEAKQTP